MHAVLYASGFSPLCNDAHPLVTGSVSPSTLYVIIEIYNWVANIGIFSCVGAWRILSASSINWHSFLEKNSVAHFVALRKLPRR